MQGEDLDQKILCVIGAGSIGQEIGRKAKAFAMQVVGIKNHPEPIEGFDQVWGRERLEEALNQVDYVVMVTPLTKETYHMIGAKEFGLMKKTAVFINVSRGDTVDESAMIKALRDRRIAGAVLDVFHEEPLPADSPLWGMDHVLLTPHVAGLSNNSEKKIIRIVYDNITGYRQGRQLINQIEYN